MKKLFLHRKGKLTKNFTQVDDEDYAKLAKHRWLWSQAHEFAPKYAVAYINDKRIFLHKTLIDCPTGMQVDHINHDSLDNRKNNLRACTQADNLRNSRVQRNNQVGYKGVCPEQGRYAARIMHQGTVHYLGGYKTALEAAAVYQMAEISLFGEFASHVML